jgi:predicted acyl esterase
VTGRFRPVAPLARTHVAASFDCGPAAQSEWLVRHALQAHQSGTSRVYVVTEETGEGRRWRATTLWPPGRPPRGRPAATSAGRGP